MTSVQRKLTIPTFNRKILIVDFLTSKNDEKNGFRKGYYKTIFADQALEMGVKIFSLRNLLRAVAALW